MTDKSIKIVFYNDTKKEQIDKLIEKIKVNGLGIVFAIDVSGLREFEEYKAKFLQDNTKR